MGTRDFDAARAERRRLRDPIGFQLGGQKFTCLPAVPVGHALDLEDAPEIVEDAALAAKSLARFIDSVLIDEDQPRFQELLRRRTDPIEGTDLFDVAIWLAGEFAGRPTSPSTDSSGGRGSTGTTSSSELEPTDSETSST